MTDICMTYDLHLTKVLTSDKQLTEVMTEALFKYTVSGKKVNH